MITFHKTTDPFSWEAKRDGLPIGFLQHHPGRDPQILITDNKTGYLKRGELVQVEAKFKELIDPVDESTRETAPAPPANLPGGGIDPSVLGNQPPT